MMTDAFAAWRQRAADADILAVALSKAVGAVLKQKGREHVGPCPRCKGEDRFSVNTARQVFNCRGAIGGDVIGMVMHANAVDFLAACELITGEAPPAKGTQLTPEAMAAAEQRRAESLAIAAKREAQFNAYRQRERVRVHDTWSRAHPLVGSSAADYLARRGLTFPPTEAGHADRLKCVESLPYVVQRGKDGRGRDVFDVVHTGPAMVAPIVDAGRVFRGLHITWLDLSTAKGKLKAVDPKNGDDLDAKKSRGSKQGNRVELIGPRDPTQLVVGEGIEKVVAIWRAMHDAGRELAGAAFWSACDLGNLAGKAKDSVRHPTKKNAAGRPVSVAGLVPDLAAPAIAIPDSVDDLVILGDSTSDEFETRLAVCRAAARYARPGRRVRVAWSPVGQDFDDLWREAADDAARQAVAARICAIVDQADAPIAPVIEQAAAAPARKPAKGRRRATNSAAAVVPRPTGAGEAGAPVGLPDANAEQPGGDPPDVDAELAARGAPPPPAAAANADSPHSSRTGGNAARSADRTRWKGPPRDGEDEAKFDRWLAKFPLTDLGNAERFYHRQRGRLIHCQAFGWLWWDGRRWSREGADGRAMIAEHETVRAIQREAQAIAGTDEDVNLSGDPDDPVMLSDKLAAWGRTSENASRLNPISKRAAPYLSVEPHELDADPFMINLANGTLVVRRAFTDADGDWQSWERVSASIRIKPHDANDLITKISPVAWRADATCPEYDGLMNLVQPSADVQRFIDDFDGYSLTGDSSEQVLVFHYGTGKNGKSTQINIKLFSAGDYGKSVPIDTFAQGDKARQAGQATPDLAMLHRVRYVSTSEPQRDWKLDEGLIKLLTGGDEVPVRELFAKSYFMLRPEFKIGMNGNVKPRILGGEKESGIWRRVKLVKWNVKIPADLRDKHFGDKLKAEAAGILNRMLRGLERWMRDGLVDAKEVAEATEQFRQDSDPLGRFLEFCTRPASDGRVQTTALYQVFAAWAKSFGEAEWKPNGFGRAMTERGFTSKKSDLNYWVGIELTKSVADFIDAQGNPRLMNDDAGGSDRGGAPQSSAVARPAGRRDVPDDEREGF